MYDTILQIKMDARKQQVFDSTGLDLIRTTGSEREKTKTNINEIKVEITINECHQYTTN